MGCPALSVMNIASSPCEAVNCHENYLIMALNYYDHSTTKFNNAAVVIMRVLFLDSSIGDDDYHLASLAIMIITNGLKQKQD